MENSEHPQLPPRTEPALRAAHDALCAARDVAHKAYMAGDEAAFHAASVAYEATLKVYGAVRAATSEPHPARDAARNAIWSANRAATALAAATNELHFSAALDGNDIAITTCAAYTAYIAHCATYVSAATLSATAALRAHSVRAADNPSSESNDDTVAARGAANAAALNAYADAARAAEEAFGPIGSAADPYGVTDLERLHSMERDTVRTVTATSRQLEEAHMYWKAAHILWKASVSDWKVHIAMLADDCEQ